MNRAARRRLQKMRVFTLRVDIDWFVTKRVVRSVLDSMLRTEVSVFAPGELIKAALNSDGEIVLNKGSKSVVARDWLPLVCQSVRTAGIPGDTPPEESTLGWYSSNLVRALLGGVYGEAEPLGPAALTGEIILDPRLLQIDDEDRVRCVVAHEIVHAIHYLAMAVPAYRHWNKFRRSFENGTNANDLLCSWLYNRGAFVDDYGRPNERAEIEPFWPSDLVDRWWKALRGSG